MSYLIAVTGKGGVGKSTLAAFLVRLLVEDGVRPVLAVDADPNSSLGPLLGAPVGQTISGIREEVLQEKANITGTPKERVLEMKLSECVFEGKGFDLITMGRPEGPTCYCYVNTLLRGALATLRSNYRAVIVDNEAGMEHLSRMNTDAIDCMVLVSEPTVASAQAVRRIVALTEELPVVVRRKVLVWNKTPETGVPEAARRAHGNCRFDDEIVLLRDDAIEKMSGEGESIFGVRGLDRFARLVEVSGLR